MTPLVHTHGPAFHARDVSTDQSGTSEEYNPFLVENHGQIVAVSWGLSIFSLIASPTRILKSNVPYGDFVFFILVEVSGKWGLCKISPSSSTLQPGSGDQTISIVQIWNISGDVGLVSAGRIDKDTPPLTTPGHTSRSSAMDISSHIF